MIGRGFLPMAWEYTSILILTTLGTKNIENRAAVGYSSAAAVETMLPTLLNARSSIFGQDTQNHELVPPLSTL